jgi:hypothetical protein
MVAYETTAVPIEPQGRYVVFFVFFNGHQSGMVLSFRICHGRFDAAIMRPFANVHSVSSSTMSNESPVYGDCTFL